MPRQRKRISTRGLLRTTRIPVLDSALAALIDRAAGLSKLDRLYQRLPPASDDRDFLQRVLSLLEVEVEASARELAHIPREGPVVVVANHPFGAIEGVIMAHLLRTLREDVRIMANGVLKQFDEISHLFIGVDPFRGKQAARRNIRPLREATRWVQGGGLLMVFPAGEVSNLRLDRLAIADPPPGIRRLPALSEERVRRSCPYTCMAATGCCSISPVYCTRVCGPRCCRVNCSTSRIGAYA